MFQGSLLCGTIYVSYLYGIIYFPVGLSMCSSPVPDSPQNKIYLYKGKLSALLGAGVTKGFQLPHHPYSRAASACQARPLLTLAVAGEQDQEGKMGVRSPCGVVPPLPFLGLAGGAELALADACGALGLPQLFLAAANSHSQVSLHLDQTQLLSCFC